jgi:flagellar biosynthesis/type III secretory pathway chaperone
MPSDASRHSESATSIAAFLAALRDEHRTLIAFTNLLQAEQNALIAGDADKVAALAGDKAAQIESLAQFNEQRNLQLAAQGLAATALGMQAWLDRHPGVNKEAASAWRQLLAQAEAARQLNHHNGVLIENKLQQNRIKLAALQTTGASDSVYHADGRLAPLRSARTFN